MERRHVIGVWSTAETDSACLWVTGATSCRTASMERTRILAVVRLFLSATFTLLSLRNTWLESWADGTILGIYKLFFFRINYVRNWFRNVWMKAYFWSNFPCFAVLSILWFWVHDFVCRPQYGSLSLWLSGILLSTIHFKCMVPNWPKLGKYINPMLSLVCPSNPAHNESLTLQLWPTCLGLYLGANVILFSTLSSGYYCMLLHCQLSSSVETCDVDNGGCEHMCRAGLPPWNCFCRSGYTLQRDRRHCVVSGAI